MNSLEIEDSEFGKSLDSIPTVEFNSRRRWKSKEQVNENFLFCSVFIWINVTFLCYLLIFLALFTVFYFMGKVEESVVMGVIGLFMLVLTLLSVKRSDVSYLILLILYVSFNA